MKGFIEVSQIDKNDTLIAIKEIKVVENRGKIVLIVLDLKETKKQILSGCIFVKETYSEVLAKIAAAVE